MILFILQNAYMNERYEFSTYTERLQCMHNSHTGRRIREMFPNTDEEIFVMNSSPSIGDSPDSCFKADLTHIKNQIDYKRPRVIVACGKIAQEGCEKLGVKYIATNHPAYRALSKKETSRVAELLRK